MSTDIDQAKNYGRLRPTFDSDIAHEAAVAAAAAATTANAALVKATFKAAVAGAADFAALKVAIAAL